MRELLAAAWLVMRIAWRTGPLAFVFTFGEIVSTTLRFMQPVMLALIIDGIADREPAPLMWGSGLLIMSLAFGGAVEAVAVAHRVKLIADVGYAFDRELMSALSRIGTLDQLEQPRLARAIGKVGDRTDAMGFCFNGVMSVMIQAAAPITSIGVAVVIDPRLAVLAVAGVPVILVANRVTRLRDRADDHAQPYAARAAAWAGLVGDSDARAERTVFRLWGWYRDNIRMAVTRRDAAFFAPARADAIGSLAAELFYLACVAAVLVWIAGDAGSLSAGAMAAALLVSLDLKGTLAALRFALTGFGPALRSAVALREVYDAARQPARETSEWSRAGGAVRSSATSGVRSTGDAGGNGDGNENGVRLRDVSYRHPAADRAALRGLDLVIEPGQVVAVVGANGAGKSTLTELLLRLRHPTDGESTVPSGAASMVAQNFGRFEFTIAESVAMNQPSDMDRVRAGLEQASPSRFWSDHPDGTSQQLGSAWPNGVDLSQGQWQAVAAARCLYVDDPELVVLDEPTAALDPEAHEAVARRYLAAARDVADRGGIAVLVTHRMSMPRLADRILVLHDGEVAEFGGHDELLALGGRYADAYRAAVAGFLEPGRVAD